VGNDADDEVLLAYNGNSQEQKREQTEDLFPARTLSPNYCVVRRWTARRPRAWAPAVAWSRGTRRNRMRTAMNCNNLEN
jgi:hypothetical protein